MVSAAEQLAQNINLLRLRQGSGSATAHLVHTGCARCLPASEPSSRFPGINPQAFAETFDRARRTGILGLFNTFAGGAVERMAIFALNIMPYISASIIMQLMTSVNKHLEQLKKEGEQGRKTINQYTRYLTVLLATVQAYGISVGLQGMQTSLARSS